MAKIRVYELAKDLNMTNKALLTKMEKMGVTVSSHMSSLENDTITLIRANLFGKKEPDHSEERVKSTVIRRRRKAVKSEESPVEEDSEPEKQLVEDMVSEESIAASSEESSEIENSEKEPSESELEKLDVAEEASEVQPKVEPKKKKKAAPKTESAKVIKKVEIEPDPIVEPEVKPQIEDKVVETAGAIEEDVEVKAQDEKEVESDSKEDAPLAIDEDIQKTADTDDVDDSKMAAKKKKKKKFSAAKIIKLPEFEAKPKPVVAKAKKQPPRRERPVTKKGPVPSQTPEFRSEDKPAVKGKKGKKGKVLPAKEVESRFSKKKKKTIVEGNALYAGGRGRKGRKGRGGKVKRQDGLKTLITTPKAIKRRIKVDDTIILAELAKRMGTKANEMIAKLMGMGVMATVNQTIDYDTATLVATEFGFEVERASFEEEVILQTISTKDEDPSKLVSRPPVVTIMGHVDHGKTSLLDVIRKTAVADGEAGGITQHIGAYHVKTDNGQISFLDTPGHEAFTAMRSRGAKVTDIVILVVAADDGVMPQTVEAINHSKAAGVPMIVAVNKIDKPGADPDRVKRELSEHGIVAEDWGGDIIFVNVSAKQKTGIDDLLEMIILQTEVLELKANPDKLAVGHVVESKLDSGRGPLATILIQEGTLRIGQSIVCGMHYGKIRGMFNDQGQPVSTAGPSIPVEITGLAGVPEAGDELVAIEHDKDAKQVSLHRSQQSRAKELAKNTRMSLEGLFAQLGEGAVKELNIIIKADVHGSIEALKESLGKLATGEVKIKVVHSATGTITESDVSLATVSNAIILGFNVRPVTKVQNMAKEENVDMRFYDIIYDAIKDLKDAMVGMMASTFKEIILGRSEVRDVFVIPKKGTVAGCFVQEGIMKRGEKVRLLRDGVIIYDGNVASLRRFKDDVKEVQHGYECGIGIENYNDLKVDDTIDCYMLEEIKPTMD